MLCFLDPGAAGEACAYAAIHCPGIELSTPGGYALDVVPRGISKAHGLDLLMEELGITPDEVVFFCDGANDMELARRVPNSVAVANATAELRELCRWHIGPVTQDAVGHALLDIARASREGGTPAFMDEGLDRHWLEVARTTSYDNPYLRP